MLQVARIEIDYPSDTLAPFRVIATGAHPLALHSAPSEIPFAGCSFFAADPLAVLRLNTDGQWDAQGISIASLPQNPFDLLHELSRPTLPPPSPEFPHWRGGWAGYLSYDAARYLDNLPCHAIEAESTPASIWLAFYDRVIALDHRRKKASITAVQPPFADTDPEKRAKELAEIYAEPQSVFVEEKFPPADPKSIVYEQTKQFYTKQLGRVREYLRDGDIYQVNYTQRVSLPFEHDTRSLFLAMCRANPAPFSAFVDAGDHQVVSASPELFLNYDGKVVTTRPIKGTRSRGRDDAQDKALRQELQESAKDVAEHLMIVDLERNDLGRVCCTGSVCAHGMLSAEQYASVHHLVSTVEGELLPQLDGGDLLCAAFPGGSITGAPKRRAMEIIAELEPVNRGIYTGSIGCLDISGAMQWNIAIRTLLVYGGKVYFHVGGGIVWDSDPEKEYQECKDKAAGLFWGLGLMEENNKCL
jgi:para-aminobenzoate synthetase component I